MGPWAFCLLSPVLCLLPAGCAPDDFGSAGDPLIGGPPVRPPSAAAVGGPPAVAAAVPPLPLPNPGGTPAALSSATRGPLDPARGELRIGDTATPTWQGTGGAGAGVALQAPQPAGGSAVPLAPKAGAEVQLTGNVAAPTYEQLKAQLQARGVSVFNIKVDAATGETTLTCFVPVKGDPTKQQTYQATRARDEVAAMRAVLEQLDKAH